MDKPMTVAQVDAEILTYEQWLRENPGAANDSKAEIMQRLRVLKLKRLNNKKNDNYSN